MEQKEIKIEIIKKKNKEKEWKHRKGKEKVYTEA